MNDYRITTDNMADLPDEYLAAHDIGLMSLSYQIDGKTYDKFHSLPSKEFYDKMRAGSTPVTSQVNPEEAKHMFEECLKTTNRILHIAFSSGLSGSCNSTRIAAEELMEERPEVQIVVIDSLCASLGEGLYVYEAVRRKEQGMPMEELAEWLESHKQNFVHSFTVEDLIYLYRGGRLSKTSAVLGNMVNLKPVLKMDEKGCLTAVSKVRGRKKALTRLVDDMEQRIGEFKGKDYMVGITHGDCLEDAEFLRDQIKERLGMENFMITPLGPTIGAHTGPGLIALFYLGLSRE
ncbi:MAG: DegV family protein [Eubacteriales bacterium]|nr:DegV family protein [Eubacteriales bacterium]